VGSENGNESERKAGGTGRWVRIFPSLLREGFKDRWVDISK
jgi:hypothetical protein